MDEFTEMAEKAVAAVMFCTAVAIFLMIVAGLTGGLCLF